MIFVNAAVVKQQSQPVVVEVVVAAGDPLGVLDLQVEVLGRAVRDVGVVEVRAQLFERRGVQGSAEAAGQLTDRAVAQAGDEVGDLRTGSGGVVESVEGMMCWAMTQAMVTSPSGSPAISPASNRAWALIERWSARRRRTRRMP
jgi:hypothetical protein